MTDSIREHFGEEHRALETHLERLRDAVEGADKSALVDEWNDFERVLRAHLEAEEAHLFPTVEASAPQAVKEAREAHVAIRQHLDELGMQVELHTVRLETVDAFLSLLRAHKAAEDEGLYRVADEALEPETREKALARAA
ncbi:MAG TPA: hemerythrin domain-containing protein [Sandaracinaceae bacterium LLY-WYZ-13_1]|nr:hemerythrin domain-containing protein [Sandaracinaceae bacterium LLY-WYZ-13_1]